MTGKYSLEVGDSFELRNANGRHLHFIVAEASQSDHSQIILVYISSSNTRYKDRTTIIQYGEHPFITKKDDESWVRYQNTIICSRDDITASIIVHYGKISSELLDRVQNGLENSPFVSKEIKNIFHEWKMNKLFDSIQ